MYFKIPKDFIKRLKQYEDSEEGQHHPSDCLIMALYQLGFGKHYKFKDKFYKLLNHTLEYSGASIIDSMIFLREMNNRGHIVGKVFLTHKRRMILNNTEQMELIINNDRLPSKKVNDSLNNYVSYYVTDLIEQLNIREQQFNRFLFYNRNEIKRIFEAIPRGRMVLGIFLFGFDQAHFVIYAHGRNGSYNIIDPQTLRDRDEPLIYSGMTEILKYYRGVHTTILFLNTDKRVVNIVPNECVRGVEGINLLEEGEIIPSISISTEKQEKSVFYPSTKTSEKPILEFKGDFTVQKLEEGLQRLQRLQRLQKSQKSQKRKKKTLRKKR